MFPLNQSREYCARFFLDDYFSCCNQFREILARKKSLSSYHQIFQNDVDGVVYETDAYWLGNREASRVVVIISGTHGIEGYCGSAIQRYLLSEIDLDDINFSDCALLFIHALNPWGMAWYRRCDEKGIDVNRNFVDFTIPKPVVEDFRTLYEALLMTDAERRNAEINRLLALWGQTRFDEIMSGGQYHYNDVPFFGGKEKSFSRDVIEQVIASFTLSEKELLVIDLHTGLGPWSFGELISDHPSGSKGNAYARKIFSNAVSVTEDGESFSVLKNGLLDYAWHNYMETKGCFLTLEFGTLGTHSLFHTLIEENLIWKSSCKEEKSSEVFEQRKAIMLKHFFPTHPLWQQAVIFRAEQIFYQCLEYFNEQK